MQQETGVVQYKGDFEWLFMKCEEGIKAACSWRGGTSFLLDVCLCVQLGAQGQEEKMRGSRQSAHSRRPRLSTKEVVLHQDPHCRLQ